MPDRRAASRGDDASEIPSAAEFLRLLLAMTPAHLKPLVDASINGFATLAFLNAGPEPVSGVSPDLGATIVICDDHEISEGPDAFAGLRQLFRRATRITVIAGPIDPAAYHDAALAAVLRRKWSVIIETQPAHRKAWLTRAHDLARGAQIVDVPFVEATVH